MVGRGLALSVDAVRMEQIEVLSSSWSCTGVQDAPREMPVSGRVRGPIFTWPFGSADTGRRIGRLMVTTEIVNAFRLAKDLEDYVATFSSLDRARSCDAVSSELAYLIPTPPNARFW